MAQTLWYHAEYEELDASPGSLVWMLTVFLQRYIQWSGSIRFRKLQISELKLTRRSLLDNETSSVIPIRTL